MTHVASLRLSTLLGVAFIVLKLCGVIRWSWWLVLLPLYGGFALMLLVIAAIAITAGVLHVIGGRQMMFFIKWLLPAVLAITGLIEATSYGLWLLNQSSDVAVFAGVTLIVLSFAFGGTVGRWYVGRMRFMR